MRIDTRPKVNPPEFIINHLKPEEYEGLSNK